MVNPFTLSALHFLNKVNEKYRSEVTYMDLVKEYDKDNNVMPQFKILFEGIPESYMTGDIYKFFIDEMNANDGNLFNVSSSTRKCKNFEIAKFLYGFYGVQIMHNPHFRFLRFCGIAQTSTTNPKERDRRVERQQRE